MMTPRFSAGAAVAPIHADQFELAGLSLAHAFHNDPLAIHMLPDADERARLLPAHFTAFLRLGCVSGEVYTTRGDPEGAAVWFPPLAVDGEVERTGDEKADTEERTLGLPRDAFERFVGVTAALEPLHDEAVPASHYYLALLGVDRDLHGQGVGSRLLQPMLAHADAEGVYATWRRTTRRTFRSIENTGLRWSSKTSSRAVACASGRSAARRARRASRKRSHAAADRTGRTERCADARLNHRVVLRSRLRLHHHPADTSGRAGA